MTFADPHATPTRLGPSRDPRTTPDEESGAGVRCLNCTFFSPDENERAPGECRVNPPVRVPPQKPSYWPIVKPDDWCGKYNPRSKGMQRPISTAR